MKLLAELDMDKGYGLIRRIKQGRGRPTIIYVKRFTVRKILSEPKESPSPGSLECGKAEVQTADFPQSRVPKTSNQDFGKSDANYNYNKENDTELNDINLSIRPDFRQSAEGSAGQPGEAQDCKEKRKSIRCQQFPVIQAR